MTDKTTVDIHGKDYETVASRVNRFRLDKDHKDLAIRTELVSSNDTYIIMKALIVDIVKNADDARVGEFVLATGYAEEKRDSNNINKTSALENCETSAIGRALAAFGYAGTEYASADEVANAILQQPKQSYTQPVQNSGDKMISDKQVKLINFKLYELKTSSLDDFDAYREWYKSLYGSKPVDKLTMSEAKLAIDKLMDMIIEPDYSDPTKYGTPDAKYDGGVTTDISEYSDETF